MVIGAKYLNQIEKVFGKEVVVHDPICGINNQGLIDKCSHVFVATPAKTHYDLVKTLLSQSKKVFCEKPLCLSMKEVSDLFYSESLNTKSQLFVDWVFTFNDAVKFIKESYESGVYGKIRNVQMNRLNSGPERKDVSAKWDLASHDVSILQYIFNEPTTRVNWNCFKRNENSFRSDTCIGIIKYDNFDAILNSSWCYGRKDRSCIFEFDAGFLHWDDSINSIKFEGEEVDFTKTKSPLENSIEVFKSGRYNHEHITKRITEVLEVGE